MYLYKGFRDPIQMISGDAYAKLSAIPIGYFTDADTTLEKRKRRPIVVHSATTEKKPRGPKPDSIFDKMFELYLVSEGSLYVAQKTGLSRQGVRYRANRLGYRYVGQRRHGYWEMPGKETPESTKRKCDPFPEANEIIRCYLLSRGIGWTAMKTGMSQVCTRKRAHQLGYRFIGNPMGGHWEAPTKQEEIA